MGGQGAGGCVKAESALLSLPSDGASQASRLLALCQKCVQVMQTPAYPCTRMPTFHMGWMRAGGYVCVNDVFECRMQSQQLLASLESSSCRQCLRNFWLMWRPVWPMAPCRLYKLALRATLICKSKRLSWHI